MAEFIPSIPLSEFKKLKSEQIRRLKCAEITSDGSYLFTFINGMLEPSGFQRKAAEYRGGESNAIGGETLEEILREEVAV
ncbi:hypothetical protein LCGC14_0902190 [marine sediment metagenome]|uniref:Uncharacterized protein n=1 Tax=marine sediment metagenome TaxID=412755 RepID=A0A0F9S303_9ZZZZ